MKHRFCASFLLASVCLMLSSCGSNKGSVTGAVTLNGEQVQYGMVAALNDKSELVASANLGTDGYRLEGLPPGSYTLTVVAHRPDGTPVIPIPGYSPPPPGARPIPREVLEKTLPDEGKSMLQKLKPLPRRYGNSKETDQKVTVKGGESVKHDISMTGTGEIPVPPSPIPPRR